MGPRRRHAGRWLFARALLWQLRADQARFAVVQSAVTTASHTQSQSLVCGLSFGSTKTVVRSIAGKGSHRVSRVEVARNVPRECPTRVSDVSVPQDCRLPQEVATRVSDKSVGQECPRRVFDKSFAQEGPTTVSHKSGPQAPQERRRGVYTRVARNSVPQELSRRVSHNGVPQECPTPVSPHRDTLAMEVSREHWRRSLTLPLQTLSCQCLTLPSKP